MAVRTPNELRESARRFREMADEGEDCSLQASVLLVAAEFDAEADMTDELSPPDPQAVDGG